MAIKSELMARGFSAGQAESVVGIVANTLTAAGSSQATALAIGADINIFTTTASSTGAILPSTLGAGDSMTVVNHGANTLSVYPPVGGKIANGSTNAAFSVAATKAATFTCIDNLNFLAELSA